MKRYGWIWAVVVMMAGCATEGTTRAPAGPSEEEGSATVETGGDAVPPEKMEEIQDILRRKQIELSHCWTDEATRTNNRQLVVDMMLKLTIGTGGKAQNVSIIKNSINSREFDKCITDMVEGFEFPAIPTSKELTWAYQFKALY